MGIKVFWIEPTDRQKLSLRRYSYPRRCSRNGDRGCDASVNFGEVDIRYRVWEDGYRTIESADDLKPPTSDPRWPKTCDACGALFEDKDEFQLFQKQIYVRLDTGERFSLREAPVGACWNAWWLNDRKSRGGEKLVPGVGTCFGDDGRSLIVRCPDGHDWNIDARASNCTMKDENTHHCWVRHGKPEDGTLHVDKNGHTCQAGAGSIQTGKWHGFLHNGELTPT